MRDSLMTNLSRNGDVFLIRFHGLIREIYRWRVSYLFMAPFLIVFSVFTVIPVLMAFYYSFTYFNVIQPPRWTGLTNYILLFMDDDIFLLSVKNTLTFAVIAGPVGYAASFLLAWLISRLRYKTPYALAFYSPSIAGGIAMSVIWLALLSGDRYGYLNNILLHLGVIYEPILWTKDIRFIMPSVILVSLWMSMGTGFLVFLAGLQNIPKELYDAGKVDGIRTSLQEMWLITIPMMRPQMLFGAVMTVIGCFNVFEVAAAIAGFPSPLYAAHTIVAHLHDYAFIRLEMGYASAIAVVLFAVSFGLNRFLFRVFSSREK